MLSDETIQKVLDFRDERDWKQFHNPKDLAISLSLEAAEVLELFQWSGTELDCLKREELKEELADVLSYVVLMADACDLDLDEILRAKTEKNALKYPVDLARGNKEKYTELKVKAREPKDD